MQHAPSQGSEMARAAGKGSTGALGTAGPLSFKHLMALYNGIMHKQNLSWEGDNETNCSHGGLGGERRVKELPFCLYV